MPQFSRAASVIAAIDAASSLKPTVPGVIFTGFPSLSTIVTVKPKPLASPLITELAWTGPPSKTTGELAVNSPTPGISSSTSVDISTSARLN